MMRWITYLIKAIQRLLFSDLSCVARTTTKLARGTLMLGDAMSSSVECHDGGKFSSHCYSSAR